MSKQVNEAAPVERADLRWLAWISAAYDALLAVGMIAFPRELARLFGAPEPVPLVNAQLNGVFTLSLAVGYLWAARDAWERRGYFWVAGVLAKALGVVLFVVDHFAQGSPAAFLLFAVSDGTLALVTWLLLARRR